MAVLLRLAGYALRVSPRLLALVYICRVGSTLLLLAIPWIIGIAIDTALEGGSTGELVLWAMLIFSVSLVAGVLAYGHSYLGDYVSQHVAYDLRQEFLARLHSLSFGFHDHQKTGDLMSRATTDVESIRWFVSFGLIHSIHVLVLVLGAAGLMLASDWDLALVALAAIPIAIYVAIGRSRRFRRMWMEVQTETGRLTTVLQENLSGMRVVKTFGAEEYEKAKFREVADSVAQKTFGVNRLHAANSSFLNLLFALATALVIWYGGWQILNTDSGMTAGGLTRFILYLGLLIFPIRMSGWIVNIFSRAISAGQRIFEVLDTVSPVEEKVGAMPLGRVKGEVRFESVSFGYESRDGHDGPQALRNVNLNVSPGYKVAVLGSPGGGKSTLVNLIPRFYDVTRGRLSIDGVDVRDVTLESLRRNVGIVFQDVFLFMASMRENISYGVADASSEQIEAAARGAQIHDFVVSLPEQYDTLVGERGVTLSGGQRQRVAIARALLQDPPILILDDSMSSVDAETESLIRKALDQLMKGRTTFVIAHRVSTVKNADLILMLEDGEIVEMGTHQQLISMDGRYRRIYELQLLPGEELLAESRSGDDAA